VGLIGELIHGGPKAMMTSFVGRTDDGAKLAAMLADLGGIGDTARPVVIQGGYSTDGYMYETLEGMLKGLGVADVTSSHLPFHGFAPIQDDAAELARKVHEASQRSIAAGGDGKVTVIGHSKGGLTARWMLQKMGGVDQVAQLITLGTPHHGSAPFGTIAARLSALMPGLTSTKQLLSGSGIIRALDGDFASFMSRARASNPDFRVVSVMGDVGGALRGTDGLVSGASARLDDRIAGVYNLTYRGEGANHIAIAGQVTPFEPTLRAVALLTAGRSVDDVAAATAGAVV
jgi:pimeloyl-ACP methyl ester carboxylesterase